MEILVWGWWVCSTIAKKGHWTWSPLIQVEHRSKMLALRKGHMNMSTGNEASVCSFLSRVYSIVLILLEIYLSQKIYTMMYLSYATRLPKTRVTHFIMFNSPTCRNIALEAWLQVTMSTIVPQLHFNGWNFSWYCCSNSSCVEQFFRADVRYRHQVGVSRVCAMHDAFFLEKPRERG